MKRAILSTCPDARQTLNLKQVYPSWERFAAKYDLEIIVIRRPIIPEHAYWDRWLCFEQPELDGFDEILWLDNDVYITDNARNPFDFWKGEGVAGVSESAQAGWSRQFVRDYYPGFMIELGPDEQDFEVYNLGVALFNRRHGELFRRAYDLWERHYFPRLAASTDPRFNIFFVREADGPFMSWQVQRHHSVEDLPQGFNFLFWTWYDQGRRLPRKLFLLQTKAAQLTKDKLPAPLWKLLFAHARSVFRQAAGQCDFLHMAASKSPLWLADQ